MTSREPPDVTLPAPVSEDQPQGLFGRSLWYVVVSLLQLLGATVISPVLAHTLGVTEFGRQALAIAIYQVLFRLAQLGIDTALSLRRARSDDATEAREIYMAGIVLAFGVGAVLFLTKQFWGEPFGFAHTGTLLTATVLWSCAAAPVNMALALLLAEDRLAAFSFLTGLSTVGGQLVGVIVVVTVQPTAIAFMWGVTATHYCALVLGIFLTRPIPRGVLAWNQTRGALRFGLPILLSQISTFVLEAGDRIVIQRDLGSDETGRYQIAYTLGAVLVLVLGIVSNSWIPRFAAMRDPVRRNALIAESRDHLYLLLAPLMLGSVLIAPIALRVISPPSFRYDTLLIVVYLVGLAAVPVTSQGSTSRVLVADERPTPLAVAAGTAAALNIVLNIVLVPPMGISGAALATLIAFGCQAGIQRWTVRGTTLRHAPVSVCLLVAAAAAVGGGSVLLPQSPTWNWARFAAAACCLPWVVLQLRHARKHENPAAEQSPPAGAGTENG